MIISYKDTLDTKIKTLAQILEMNNYKTLWVNQLPTQIGPFNKDFGRGFEYFIYNKNIIYGRINNSNWIEENKNKKFFMFLSYADAHGPYTPSIDTVLKFTNKTNEKIIFSYEKLWDIASSKIISNASIVFNDNTIRENESIFNNKTLLRQLLPSLCQNQDYSIFRTTCGAIVDETFWENINASNNSDVDYIKLLYDSKIYEIDREIERLVDTLKNEGLMNKTILIITADHGNEFMDHGNIGHGSSLYDEVIHVPLIIWIPGSKAKEVSSLVQSIDIMPTILDLIGINIPNQVQGVSLLPLIEGKNISLNEYVYGETFKYLSSIRSSNWKYIINLGGIEELYNLEKDPMEKNNLTNIEPKIAEQMKNKLEEHNLKNILK